MLQVVVLGVPPPPRPPPPPPPYCTLLFQKSRRICVKIAQSFILCVTFMHQNFEHSNRSHYSKYVFNLALVNNFNNIRCDYHSYGLLHVSIPKSPSLNDKQEAEALFGSNVFACVQVST